MDDYREKQLLDLEKKIEETKTLLLDSSLKELAQKEILELEEEKKQLRDSIDASYEEESDESLDDRNIILELSGAAGGEEAKLWGEELLRMYTRFAQLKGFKVENLNDGVIKIEGRGAFAAFKFEAGVHRVQRVPKTEKRGRIHTSTATVAVLPEIPEA